MLYAARAGADYELTRTERASADVRELSASIATHDELYDTRATAGFRACTMLIARMGCPVLLRVCGVA